MERYRNIVKIEKVKDLLEKGKQREALSLAREIKPEKLKNIMDVCALGECFFVNGCYEEAKQCYRQAYDMNPTRKVIVAMINLAIRTKNVEEAKFYIDKFETTAPGDYNKFVYRYNLLRMEKRPVAELIAVLKELCEFEYIDKWAYELVKLYHKAGMKKECLEECENIILWFGYGEYVEKTNALIAYYKGELNPTELVNSRKEESPDSFAEENADYTEEPENTEEAGYGEEPENTEEADYGEEPGNTEEAGYGEEPGNTEEAGYGEEFESIAEIGNAEAPESTAETGNTEAPENAAVSGYTEKAVNIPEEYAASEREMFEQQEDIVSAERIEEARRKHREENERRAAEEEKKQQEAEERREELKRKAEEDDKKFEETLLQIIDDEKIKNALSEIGIASISGKPEGEVSAEDVPEKEEPETETAESVKETETACEAETMGEAVTAESVNKTETVNETENVSEPVFETGVFSDLNSLLKTPEPAYDSRLARALRKGGLSLEEAVGIYTDFESLGAQYVRCMEILLNPKASGMGIVVSGPDKCGKTSLVKGMGKLLSLAERVESSGIMVVEAEKLNEIDLETRLPKLEGHAVLINHAGKISADTAESMARLQNRIEASTVLILEDERAAITALFRTNPKLNKAFSNRINLESVSLEMLFRFAARHMIRKEYSPDASAAARLEQLIRKYYKEDKAGCLAKTINLIRQTLKNADNRCAKVLLEYSTDGKLAQLDMSVIKGEDVSETEI